MDADPLIAEQLTYYRAVAGEYEDHALALPGGQEVEAALDAFAPRGDVLELACGPGTWTPRLLVHATTVTAVDAAPEMLAIARKRVPDRRVQFVQADLFGWSPDRRYDVVFFGFWLSHVPEERFDSFWELLADCLAPDGRVFFVDDGHRSPDEMTHGPASPVITRRTNDGKGHRIVKVPLRPEELEDRLLGLGWRIQVRRTAGPFFWGEGRPPEPPRNALRVARPC